MKKHSSIFGFFLSLLSVLFFFGGQSVLAESHPIVDGGGSSLVITTRSLPQGKVGASYSATISASGGGSTYKWSYTGTLPPGLRFVSLDCHLVFAPTCRFPASISGTPKAGGKYTIRVTVSDDLKNVASKEFTIVIETPTPPTPLPPSLSSLNPTSGPVGTTVTINGSGFLATNNIYFGEGFIPNVSSSNNGTRIVFRVPDSLNPPCYFNNPPCMTPSLLTNPGTYAVRVSNTNGTSNSLTFTVTTSTTPLPPSLSSLNPTSGPVGTTVTINGSGFLATNNVRFGVGSIPNVSSSDNGTRIVFTVPTYIEVPPPPCAVTSTESGSQCSPPAPIPVTPGPYNISVSNTNGTSNSLTFTVTTTTVASGWSFVDGGGANGINYNVSKDGRQASLKSFNGKLYVAWVEANGRGGRDVRVKKYDGSSWSPADSGSLNRNPNTSVKAHNPELVSFNNKLYLVWTEETPSGATRKIRVRESTDGLNWAEDVSLNYSGGRTAYYKASVAVFQNKLYVMWPEKNAAGTYQIRYKAFDGANWTNDSGSLNYNRSKTAVGPYMAVFGNKLYAVWREENASGKFQIRAKSFDGVSWSSADSGSLNVNSSKKAFRPRLAEMGGSLYLTWIEYPGRLIYVRKFNGSAWEGAVGPINYSGKAFGIDIFSFNNTLYAVWGEQSSDDDADEDGGLGGGGGVIRIKRSTDGTNWIQEDTGILNYSSSAVSSRKPRLGEFEGKLYSVWSERSANQKLQIRVKKKN